MTDDGQKIDIAKLQESLSSLRESLQEVKQLLKELSIENFKRHEETRDSYYIAEMTRKRFEEQSDIIEDKIKSIVSEIDRLRQSSVESISELKQEIKYIRENQRNRMHYIAKIVGLILLGAVTGKLVIAVEAILRSFF